MSIDLTRHDDQFSTAGQLIPEQMAELARLGYRTVVDNRPDGEGGPAQPGADEMRKAAQAHGLHFVYLPVISGGLTATDVETFARDFDAWDKPVLAYCRSGARSTQLYRLAMAGRHGG